MLKSILVIVMSLFTFAVSAEYYEVSIDKIHVEKQETNFFGKLVNLVSKNKRELMIVAELVAEDRETVLSSPVNLVTIKERPNSSIEKIVNAKL